jgi:hypothetical protein
MQVSLPWFPCSRHGGVITERRTTYRPESKEPGALRRSLGGFDRLQTRRSACRIRTRSNLGGRTQSSTGTRGAFSTTWALGCVCFGTVFSVLGVRGQCTFKLNPRMHTDSDFDILYMDGKITTRPLQCHWCHLQIRPELSGFIETSQSPETVSVLRHRIGPLGLVPS